MTEQHAFKIIVGSEKPKTVITLKEARRRYDYEHCQHHELIVDEQYALLECGTCKAQLNPIDVLARFAREEVRLYQRVDEVNALLHRLAQRKQTTCQHCGKITKISGW